MTDTEFLESLKSNNEALLTATRDNAADFFSIPKSNQELCYFFGGRAYTSYIVNAYLTNDVHTASEQARATYIIGHLAEKNAAEKFLTLANLYSDTPKTLKDFITYISENRIKTGTKLFTDYLTSEVSEQRPVTLLFLWVLNLCLIEVLRELKNTIVEENIIDILNSLLEDKIRSVTILYIKLIESLQGGVSQSILENNIDKIRKDFYELSAYSTSDLESSRTLVNTTYGWEY